VATEAALAGAEEVTCFGSMTFRVSRLAHIWSILLSFL